MSRRRSSRRRDVVRRQRIIIATAGVVALAGVAYLIWGGGPRQTPARDLIGATLVDKVAAEAAKTGTPVTAPSAGPSATEVNELMRSVTAEVKPLKGPARQDAFKKGYERTAKMLEGTMDPTVRTKLLPFFHMLTDQLFLSAYRNEYCDVYVVKSGDAMQKIAKTNGVTEELICLWNGIEWDKRTKLQISQPLKIVKGQPRVVVSKSEFTLSYYFGDNMVRQYIVAHGKNNNTPVGVVKVTSKEVDPDVGANKNESHREMKDRWIGLSAFDESGSVRNGIGIHGTKYEDQIPGETSMGCVRMFSKDVIELYSWTPYGMQVEIRA